ARVIVANDRLTSRFNSIRREILSRVRCSNILKHDITSMRTRMMQSKTYKIDKLKLSAGGINDIEFIVQYYVLRWSVGHPLISEHSDNMRIIDSLVATGILSAQVAEKIRKAYLLYRDIIHKEILYGKNNFTVDKDIMTENLYLIKALWSNIFSGHSNRIINAK
ncbi:MAG: hypothetical protein HOI53_09340, partial [Francisellaceae bacterium]|nr:hypothetical protein [Francisellaceae bacterium]